MLSANHNFLSPQVVKLLEKAQPLEDVSFVQSKDGLFVPKVGSQVLHSRYYPLKEGSRYDFGPANEGKAAIAIGFGAGYHLVEECKKRRLFVVPLNYSLLKAVLSTVSLSDHFSAGSLTILTEAEVEQQFDYFQDKDYHFVVNSVLQKLYPQEALSAVQKVRARLEQRLLDLNTQRHFGKLWFKNILKNSKRLLAGEYSDRPLLLDGKPVLIAGAGPSLEHNMESIREQREMIYLAAADTAAAVLASNGVTPDFIFSFDANPHSYLHLLGKQYSGARLFVDFTSPLFSEQLETTLLFSAHPFARLFRGLNPVTIDSASLNIGGAIVDFFSRYFPGYPIATVGIDFAAYGFTGYSRGSYLSDYYLAHGDYFKSPSSIEADLFYRSPYKQSEGEWKSTGLYRAYAGATAAHGGATLSTSPFTPFKPGLDLQKFASAASKHSAGTLNFDYDADKVKQIVEGMTDELQRDSTPLLPYLLALGVRPDSAALADCFSFIDSFFS